MGTAILIIGVLIEAAFTVYCIITKSNQSKAIRFLRIGAFAAFLALTLATVIEWSFRWYALAGLLTVWAAPAGWALIFPKEDKNGYRVGRVIGKAIGAVLLIVISLMPALVFPQIKPLKPSGAHPVQTAVYTWTDENRVETYTDTGENRKVNVTFWYPAEAEGTFPLVVFSHGANGIRTSNETLYNELASHGYVVCSIDHPYHSMFTKDVNGKVTMIDMGYLQDLQKDDPHNHKAQSVANFQKWMGVRMGDINFVIDHILSETGNDAAETVYRRIDPAKIGVMGHSLGGAAALGIGRMRGDVSAVIALESAFLSDIQGVDGDQFVFTDEAYPLPVLNVYSDATWSHLSEWAQYAENYAMLSDDNPDSFNIYIRGAGHLTLTDLALVSPFLTRLFNGQESEADTTYCLQTINKLTLEFFDSYLKGKGDFTAEETW
ncbi:MAG TPA: hypothetical protein VHO48_00735 [Anaerolineaceae bacterium]|nr:hypothetical protein [Anaerolineaceae bacterium]